MTADPFTGQPTDPSGQQHDQAAPPPALPQRTRATTAAARGADLGISPFDLIQHMMDAVPDFAALHAAVELGIFELLCHEKLTSDELAACCACDPAATRRLMRWLHGGRFVTLDCDRYQLTPYGQVLTAAAERSQRHAVLVTGSSYWWDAAGNLTETVRRGHPAWPTGLPPYDYLAHHPAIGREFDLFMTARSAAVSQDLAAFDYDHVRTIADLGGGLGGVLTAILRKHPHLRGILADRQDVLDRARDHLATQGLADRIQLAAGDLFDRIPHGAEVYLLSSVLHNYSTAQGVDLLTTVRHTIEAGDHPAEVWIIQGMLPGLAGQPSRWYSTDARMLSLFPGDGVQDRDAMFRMAREAGLHVRKTNQLPTSQQTLMITHP
ncbi:methyltransferase [Nonomuraea sp. NPDC050202]|uniref:methyltransferase n=1 Tax=Nonomuraea sp. NPDC050202 TaxID=3155035 RepID=UPI0033FB3735